MRTESTEVSFGAVVQEHGGLLRRATEARSSHGDSLSRARFAHPVDRIVYPEVFFRAILARDRASAQRLGHRFCLLELRLPDHAVSPAKAKILAQEVASGIRDSDAAGWLGATCMGVLLPAATGDDPRALADALIHSLASRRVDVEASVHPYPPEPTHSETRGAPPGGGIPEVDRVLFARIPRWKRVTDVTLALLAILALVPVFLLIILCIEIVSPGPFLFHQRRIGHLGQPFTCWKFRSMRMDATDHEHRQHVQTLLRSGARLTKLDDTGDNRLMPLGRIFRASGLDELPQLFNVLFGEMSLVGPRPCVSYELDEFVLWERDRCLTPPGLTGLWQVSGKNRTTVRQMLRLDVRYAHHRRLGLDLLILFSTPFAVVSQVVRCLIPRVPLAVTRELWSVQQIAREGVQV